MGQTIRPEGVLRVARNSQTDSIPAKQREDPQRIFTGPDNTRDGFFDEQKTSGSGLCVVEWCEERGGRAVDDVAGESGFVDPERAVREVLPQSKGDSDCDKNEAETVRGADSTEGGNDGLRPPGPGWRARRQEKRF